MESIAKYIDYTLLKATARAGDVASMCQEALEYGFAAICIQPVFVKLSADLLAGSGVGIATVVGFPFGAALSAVKAFEAEQAMKDGATEIDMVMNIGTFLAGQEDLVERDMEAVVGAVAGKGIVKVIIETAYLDKEQIRTASRIVQRAGADYVKTSTGYAPSGAKAEDIRLIRETLGPGFGIKAAGGISDYATARAMVLAGATRIGASQAVKILSGESGR